MYTTNQTILTHPDDYCTLDLCPLSLAHFTYVPTLAGNATYLAIFAFLIIPQVFLGFWYRTWGFMVGMVCGLILEVIGYAGRVQLHFNPFPFNPFLEYLICLTIGPAFLSAAIYLCLGRIVVAYGEHFSRITPRTYTFVFVSCDLLSLILQAVGGGIAATSAIDRKQHGIDVGVDIMIAGLSTQVASLFIFMVLCAEYGLRVRKHWGELDDRFTALRSSKVWKLFLVALALATVTIFIRCCYRVAELHNGFMGALFNDEVDFMVLEGPMIIIACVVLTVLHPGIGFKGQWDTCGWSIRSGHAKTGGSEKTSGGSEDIEKSDEKNGRDHSPHALTTVLSDTL